MKILKLNSVKTKEHLSDQTLQFVKVVNKAVMSYKGLLFLSAQYK